MHGFDLSRLLVLMGKNEPPDVLVLGVEPYYLGWSMELSRPVADAVPFLVEAVKREIIG